MTSPCSVTSDTTSATNLAAEDEETQFCRHYPHYGFPCLETGGPRKINQLVQDEFSHLSSRHYLDYAGAAPVPSSVAKSAADDMLHLGNPHSLNAPGKRAAKRIRSVRHFVTQTLIGNAEDYVCVFTSGATAALKLVADCFPWQSDSQFVSSVDSHDSARGIRDVALSRGATATQITLDHYPNSMEDACSSSGQLAAHHLFTFPGEDNVTGTRHDIAAWVGHTQKEFLHVVFGDEAQGRTVLMVAASMGLHEMVDVLIHVLGADVNHASSTDGDTALHRAACKGHPAICELILASGADVQARVRNGALAGWTASQVAEWKASGDRSAHPKAHLANYNPYLGGAFAEAASVLRAAEKKV